MRNSFFILISCVSLSAAAQSVDSTKTPAPKTNAFSKYQQPSQFGVQPAPVPTKPQGAGVQPDMVKKLEDKRVNSSYQYENGRVTGGKTSIQLGKKKDQ
ncbi:hypothetical protein GO755_14710 [Spirosoma sp. HMF4905]|uniref:Uncharacterized protein n=1 Tax=Spirosoma arboris TaxID=2682092 RepID=A0A7K1SBV0_9BACT|nr:hypothetical protein [Spirosoma arboris]MVM31292.1 hypothetical protein [Spirosoma arboris]